MDKYVNVGHPSTKHFELYITYPYKHLVQLNESSHKIQPSVQIPQILVFNFIVPVGQEYKHVLLYKYILSIQEVHDSGALEQLKQAVLHFTQKEELN